MLQLAMAFSTAAVAVTLVPPVRRWMPRPLEAAAWIGFVATSFFVVVTLADPVANDATLSLIWGVGKLVQTQAANLLGVLTGWTVAHRFAIAGYSVLAVGADALALVLIRTMRVARLSDDRVRLREWFVLPALTPATAVVPNPLAAADKRLAEIASATVLSIRRSALASRLAGKVAIASAHFMRPGYRRLMLVRFAVGIGAPRGAPAYDMPPVPAPAAADAPLASSLQRPAPVPAARHRRRQHRGRAGRTATALPIKPLPAGRKPQPARAGKRGDVTSASTNTAQDANEQSFRPARLAS